jgi:hypothetical protein
MSDDKSNRGNPDRQRIDIEDRNEVRNWCQSLAVTEDQLRDAVKAVGAQAAKVREFLGKTVARP